jgi:hypothetical protein
MMSHGYCRHNNPAMACGGCENERDLTTALEEIRRMRSAIAVVCRVQHAASPGMALLRIIDAHRSNAGMLNTSAALTASATRLPEARSGDEDGLFQVEPYRDIVDVKQVIYALERAERALRAQADELHDAGDYSAEFPAEDADRMREAIDLLRAKPVT